MINILNLVITVVVVDKIFILKKLINLFKIKSN